MKKMYAYTKTGAIKRQWVKALVEYRELPDIVPAPRPLPQRLQLSNWCDKERAHHDNHRRRDHRRRTQKQHTQRERMMLLAQYTAD